MNKIADLGFYAFIVAGIVVTTRPGSQGPGVITAFANGLTHLVQGASGQAIKY